MSDINAGTLQFETQVDLAGLDKGLDQVEGQAKGRLGKIGDILKGAFSTALGFGIADIASNALGSVVGAIQGGIADALRLPCAPHVRSAGLVTTTMCTSSSWTTACGTSLASERPTPTTSSASPSSTWA